MIETWYLNFAIFWLRLWQHTEEHNSFRDINEGHYWWKLNIETRSWTYYDLTLKKVKQKIRRLSLCRRFWLFFYHYDSRTIYEIFCNWKISETPSWHNSLRQINWFHLLVFNTYTNDMLFYDKMNLLYLMITVIVQERLTLYTLPDVFLLLINNNYCKFRGLLKVCLYIN